MRSQSINQDQKQVEQASLTLHNDSVGSRSELTTELLRILRFRTRRCRSNALHQRTANDRTISPPTADLTHLICTGDPEANGNGHRRHLLQAFHESLHTAFHGHALPGDTGHTHQVSETTAAFRNAHHPIRRSRRCHQQN